MATDGSGEEDTGARDMVMPLLLVRVMPLVTREVNLMFGEKLSLTTPLDTS